MRAYTNVVLRGRTLLGDECWRGQERGGRYGGVMEVVTEGGVTEVVRRDGGRDGGRS